MIRSSGLCSSDRTQFDIELENYLLSDWKQYSTITYDGDLGMIQNIKSSDTDDFYQNLKQENLALVVQGPSSFTAHNLVECSFCLFLSVLNFWGML